MKIFTKIVLILILGCTPVIIKAQKTAKEKIQAIFQPHWNVQLNGGITQYFGDLNKDYFFNKNVKEGFGGALGYQFSPIFGVRGQFMKGKLFSQQDDKQLRLNTDLWDASLQLTANINDIFSGYNPRRFVNFYLFGGAGITSFSSTLTDYSGGVEFDTAGSSQNEFFVPLGLGASFRLAKNISLNLEYADHITFNDNTLDLFPASKARDQYSYASAGIGFTFGSPRDKDKDGVRDKDDLCPDAAGKIELLGCPDKDDDGIADSEDACPDIAGKVEFKGCPDSDGDEIPDKDDKCPNAAGKKELKGCPDKDNDGVTDMDDKCPDVAGKKDLAGCPDKDGDGVADNEDGCPELAGLKKFAGCPDKDNDGVSDNKDQCPEVAGAVDNSGCPIQASALVDDIVYFETDEFIVIASYNQLLSKVAETMRDNPGIRVTVDGHTDSRESAEYNLRLSERRADYVIKFFTERGIDENRLIKGFYGKSRPVADNSTEEGMRLNRRVEIKSVK